jgi:chromosome segregation ATPase
MPERHSPQDDLLDLEEDLSAPAAEQLDSQVAQAQERLSALKRQAEQLEREKQKLEELSRRQEQFDAGRAEMVDKFTGSLVQIQRETDETLKRLEILKNVQASFTSYLQEIEAINPKEWSQAELPKELSRAIGAIEDARSVYTKSQAQVAADDAREPHVLARRQAEGEFRKEVAMRFRRQRAFLNQSAPRDIAGIVGV